MKKHLLCIAALALAACASMASAVPADYGSPPRQAMSPAARTAPNAATEALPAFAKVAASSVKVVNGITILGGVRLPGDVSAPLTQEQRGAILARVQRVNARTWHGGAENCARGPGDDEGDAGSGPDARRTHGGGAGGITRTG